MWAYKLLRTKHFHGVSSGNQPPYLLKSRYGKVSIFWAGDGGETGQILHGYQSVWLPAALLHEEQQPRLSEALFAATRHWDIALHCNKGLAGAPAEAMAAAQDTAINPAVLAWIFHKKAQTSCKSLIEWKV